MLVYAALDNVQLASDTPLRPGGVWPQVHKAAIWLLKLYVEVFQDGGGKPGYIFCRTSQQFLKAPDVMFCHEFLKMRARYRLCCRLPNDFPGETKSLDHRFMPYVARVTIY